jgi:predicted PurR-regulated permease PerM
MQNRVFFLITFLILIVLAVMLLKPFISTIMLALITIIVLKPLYSRILKLNWIKSRARLSASLTLILTFILIIVPVYFLARVTLSQIADVLATIDLSIIETLNLGTVVDAAVVEAEGAIELGTVVVVQAVASLGSTLLRFFVDAMIFVIIFITLMPEFDNGVKKIEDISPLGKEISQLYYKKTAAMISSLVKGMFIIALLQGAIMGFFYLLAGMDLWFLFMIISMVLAILPIVGISWLVLMLSALAVIQGDVSSAIIIFVGFYGVANWVDVILRPRLVSKDAYLHFSLVLLGILGGIVWAGFLGLFYGPVIMLLLVTTVEIYSERYAKDDSLVIRDYISDEGTGDVK